MRARRALLLYAAAAAIYGLDQITKSLAEEHLRGRPPIELISGVVELRYVTNAGGAFGLFGGVTWLFVAASLVVIALIAFASRDLPGRQVAVALGLLLGGAVGNLTDRALRGPGFSGRVVDFVDLQIWPVFNLADSAIVIGAALLLVAGVGRSRRNQHGEDGAT
ncbi:MAG: signal peptidase II [Actinomycetota bacterium]